MPKAARKPLEPWQKQDADRLLELWNKRDPKISQASAASLWEIGETQGILWQYLHGVIPLNLRVAAKFARGLRCEIADFSPKLAGEAEAFARDKPRKHILDDAPLSEAEAERIKRKLDDLWDDLAPSVKRGLLRQAAVAYDVQIEQMEAAVSNMKRKHRLGPAIEDHEVVAGFKKAASGRARRPKEKSK